VTSESIHIDNFRPVAALRPNSVAELGEIVRRAAAEEVGLYPAGGGTMLHLGLSPVKPGYLIDLRGLDQVIDYPARDMTVTVQTGITIAKLQQILAKENQRLPIDVPHPEIATLGGAIAVNASGPRRYGFGTLRDYVIGISFTDDAGHEAKAGGRVVKNVAGYDLCKLHIGAFGTLGIVTQVTLKLKPLPEECGLLVVPCQAERLSELLSRIHGSKARPVCVEAIPGTVIVGFEDNGDAVRWQLEQSQHELSGNWQTAASIGDAAAKEWKRLLDAPSPPAHLEFKANLLPSGSADFIRLLEQAAVFWRAHAGNGIVTGTTSADLTLADANRMLSELRAAAVAAQGNLVVTRCPTAWKQEIKLWGEPRGDWPLMRKVKNELDPRDLFNPGRFIV
jgi:glycolate oxidase FAD binding subunit